MVPLVTQGSTPTREQIQEAILLDSELLASPADESGSLVRSSVESGCPSLDTLLEEAEDIELPAKGDVEGETGQYLCPMYQGGPSSTPGPPVLMVPLPAGPHGADYWVQRRVAMYLSQH